MNLYPNAQVILGMILGPRLQELIENGYPVNPEGNIHVFPLDHQVQLCFYEN
jgi:hypothetical protein